MILDILPEKRPVLTIIIPVHDKIGNIPNLLSSIDFKFVSRHKLEVLVIDETSNKNLQDYITQWSYKHPNQIHYFSTFSNAYGNKRSWGNAIALGIKKSYGHYIKIVDVTDTFEYFDFSNYLRTLEMYLGFKKKPELIISSYEYYNDRLHESTEWFNSKAKENKTIYIDIDKFYLNSNISHHALTFLRETMHHVKEIPYNIFYNDIPLIQQVLTNVKTIALTPRNLLVVRYHISSTERLLSLNTLYLKTNSIKEIIQYIGLHLDVSQKIHKNIINNITTLTFALVCTTILSIMLNNSLTKVQKINEAKATIEMVNSIFKKKHLQKIATNSNKIFRKFNKKCSSFSFAKKLIQIIYGEGWKIFLFEIQNLLKINDNDEFKQIEKMN